MGGGRVRAGLEKSCYLGQHLIRGTHQYHCRRTLWKTLVPRQERVCPFHRPSTTQPRLYWRSLRSDSVVGSPLGTGASGVWPPSPRPPVWLGCVGWLASWAGGVRFGSMLESLI